MTSDNTQVMRKDLSKRLRERLREKESFLNQTCRKLWSFNNPHGECFIFGWFKKKGTPRGEGTVVTVARYEDAVGWIWPPFDQVS